MTNQSDPKTIEADIQRERASLASTLNALQDRVSVDTLAREAMDALRNNAATYTRNAEQMIRANPMALALTGVGLAWLIFGGKSNDRNAPKHTAVRRWEDEGGQVAPVGTASEAWYHEATAHRDRAHQSIAQIDRSAKHTGSGAHEGSGMKDRAMRAAHDLQDDARERAAVAKEFASGLADSFRHGLEDLSDSAKERIVAAREQAYAAVIAAEKQAQHLSKSTGRLIEDQPLISGAIAAALGAGLAAALPHTDTEDRSFGRQSDSLMRQAKQMLTQERDRAMRVAKGVVDEVQSSAKDVMSAAKDSAEEASARVKDRAVAEAEDKSKA